MDQCGQHDPKDKHSMTDEKIYSLKGFLRGVTQNKDICISFNILFIGFKAFLVFLKD